ncbi:hypothetical protein DMA11_16710 [Marinilabiliaceae bacterium JC017]|nr:hypothetical protein DMA11_16710 [Marinilabiliaceae bacterium JC017]
MKFFDLHCHPSLKPMLSLARHRPTPWDYISVKADNIISNIYDSQSNADQLMEGSCNLACVALYPLEEAIAEQSLLQLVAGPVRYIDKRQIRRISKVKDGFTYSDLLQDELHSLVAHKTNPVEPLEQIKIITSMDQYDPDDDETLHVIITIEGGHALYYGKNQWGDAGKVVQNIEKLKTNSGFRVLYITPTHLSQNAFINHAHGMKIFSKRDFVPMGHGITPLGHEVIKTCLAGSNGNRILIDIKHFSLCSRLQYYQIYGVEAPIIASHVGVTGCSYKDMPERSIKKRHKRGFAKVKYEKLKGHIEGTCFNPNSINLYDEDIEHILESGGLIGLNLDQRILGYTDFLGIDTLVKESSKEFVSLMEVNLFEKGAKFTVRNEEIESDREDQEDETFEKLILSGNIGHRISKNIHVHTKYLLNNILHILQVGQKLKTTKGIDPTDHICIGSDFDGLVNAIDSCTTANKFPQLAQSLESAINDVGSELIPDAVRLVEKICFTNGYEFLMKHFK